MTFGGSQIGAGFATTGLTGANTFSGSAGGSLLGSQNTTNSPFQQQQQYQAFNNPQLTGGSTISTNTKGLDDLFVGMENLNFTS